MDISKYFRESIWLWDNEIRMYFTFIDSTGHKAKSIRAAKFVYY